MKKSAKVTVMFLLSFAEQFFASQSYAQWIEPIWKILLSNKGILPILWELFPHHAN